MKLGFTSEQERFRAAAATWLEDQLSGAFADLRGVSGHGDMPERRKEWEQVLGCSNWSCVGWPRLFGGRDATLAEQVIFAEEYARAGGPNRIGHLGVELVGPTLLAMGTAEQQQRFLPPIARGEEIWCQGYSEPNAGSDLANVRTSARIEHGPNGAQWVINGQKIWTSLAQFSDWIFVLARTESGSRGHRGLSYLLVPMSQPGVSVHPIREMTGDATFNETFFQDACTPAHNVVGAPGDGWKVAMATLGFERGVSTLAHQMAFRRELDSLIAAANENGAARDPCIRQRLADAYIGLKVMRYSALRMLTHVQSSRLEEGATHASHGLTREGNPGPTMSGRMPAQEEAYTYRLYWGEWHQKLGELAMDVLGPAGEIAAGGPYEWEGLQKMFLFSRADTIYGGTSQIQRNIIAERALGLPKEPRGQP